MSTPVFAIDLDDPPATRWRGLAPHASAIRKLCDVYLEDLGGVDEYTPLLAGYEAQCLTVEQRAELDAVAAIAGRPHAHAALANLYYDALKFAFSGLLGCTAFGVDTASGPLHARNLDWHAPHKVLQKHTAVFELRRSGRVVARTVGWPGFIGAFSGVAPGKFSVTLNAVLSEDPPAVQTPVTFLIREVLETASDFDEAVLRLAETPIASDCLLLVVGARPGDRVVVERTPSRHALRTVDAGPLVVTNDYRSLTDGGARGILGATACQRFDRARLLANTHLTPPQAFSILGDPEVKMEITVQQMVLLPVDGSVWVDGAEVCGAVRG